MRDIAKQDRKAPRFRLEKLSVINRFFFDEFKKEFPRYKDVSNNTLKTILEKYHTLVKDKVANTRDGVELLEQLGYMFVGSSSKKKGVDYIQSDRYGVELRHQNWDSNQWLCKIYYTNFGTKYRFRNSHLWAFEACRSFKEQVSKAYIKNYKLYIITDKLIRISKIFRKDNGKFWYNKKNKKEEE